MEAREGIKVQIAVPQGPFIQSDDLVRGNDARPASFP